MRLNICGERHDTFQSSRSLHIFPPLFQWGYNAEIMGEILKTYFYPGII